MKSPRFFIFWNTHPKRSGIPLSAIFILMALVFVQCSGNYNNDQNSNEYLSRTPGYIDNPLGRYVDDSLYFRWFLYNYTDSLFNSSLILDSPLKKGLKNTAIIMNSDKITDTLAVMPFYDKLLVEEEFGKRWYSNEYFDELDFYELFSLYHFILKFEKGKTKHITISIMGEMWHISRSKGEKLMNILYTVENYYYYSYLEEELTNFNRYSDSLLVIYPDWKYLKEYKNNIPTEKAEWK